MRWSPTRILSASLVAVVLLLAVQQWRWIHEIEGHEHYRQDRRVGYATWIFKTFFDRELEVLIRWMHAPRGAPEEAAGDLAHRYGEWRDWSRWPDLVSSLYVATPETAGEAPSLHRLDVATATLERVEWPPRLRPLAAVLADPPSLASGGTPTDTWVLPSVPAIVGLSPSRRGASTLVVLDEAYLASTMLPEMVRMAFPPPSFDGIDLTVVEASNGRVVYSTAPPLDSEAPAPVDSAFGLLREGAGTAALEEIAARLDPGASGPGEGRSFIIPGAVDDPTDDDEAWFRAHWSWLSYDGHWRVWVRSREGPAAEQAAVGRNRHLLAAFGLLAVLAAAIGVVVGTHRRAEGEARRELEGLAVVSHELRTPLTVLSSAGDNLADGIAGGSKRARQYGRLILRETRRLEELVENVLHLARGRSGVSRPGPQPVEVAHLVEDALQAMSVSLDEARFTVETELPEEPLHVNGDARALRSALVNLISNGIRHAAEGRWLRLTARRGQAGEVRITVEDRGPGLDPQELSRLVRPFVRGERPRAEGSGLGLAVVQEVMAAHGGRICARRRDPEGAEISLVLPRAEPT